MPRLPDVQSYDPRPAVGPQRQIVGYDTPGIAESEAMAPDLSPIGGVLSEQAQRVWTRKDALDRIDKSDLYEAEVADELRSLQASGDLSSDETITAYGEMLSTRRQALLAEHKGSAESRAQLDAELSDIRSRYAGQIAVQSAVAQQAKVRGRVDTTINTMAARAGQDPGAASALIEELDRRIDSLSGAMSPEEDQAARRDGRAQILVASAEALMDRGNVEGARIALADPEAAAIIPADTMRRLQGRINDQTSAGNALEVQIAQAETIMGRRLTPQERTAVAQKSLGLSAGGPDPSAVKMQEIATAERILGRSLSEQEKLAALELAPKSPLVSVQTGDQGPKLDEGQGLAFIPDQTQESGYRAVPIPGGKADVAAQQRAGELAETGEKAAARRQSSVTDAITQLQDVDSALGLLAEGAGGPIEGSIPGAVSAITNPKTFDLQGQVDAIKGRIGFSELNQMRQESPTGGALGQVSVREVEFLQALEGQLDIRNPERLQINLNRIREGLLNVWFGTPEEHERAIEEGRLTEADVVELNRQRAETAFDVKGRPVEPEAPPPASAAAGKPIAEMSVTEMQAIVADPARVDALSDAEFAELESRLRTGGMAGTADLATSERAK